MPTPLAAIVPLLAAVSFTDVARESGVDFVHRTGFDGGYWFPEITGAGVAVFDADGDGREDVFFVDGGKLGRDGPVPDAPRGNALYRNRGDGTFEDVSARAGVGGRGYGQGCAVADWDADGDLDLYVANYGPNELFRNDGGGRFTEIGASAGVDHAGWSTAAVFADLDGDDRLDLFVVNYCLWSPAGQHPCRSARGEPDYCQPAAYEPAPDVYYRNRGDGTFEDATRAAGFSASYGHGLGAFACDFDDDADADLFVANDGDANSLWINDGAGRFRDEGLFSGTAFNDEGMAEASMGVTVGDVERDGDWDLLVTHLTGETNTLYRNDGDGLFTDVTEAWGLGSASRPFTGFGTLLFDADVDGDPDLFVANGAVLKDERPDRGPWPYAQRNQFFVQDGGGFREVAPETASWLRAETVGRGAAFGDLDADGDVDVVVGNAGGPPSLLRNDTPRESRRWLGVRLVAAGANREGLGSRVRVTASGVPPRTQWITRGGSYASANEPRALFGFPAEIEEVTVEARWPDGTSEVWTFGTLDTDVRLVQGTGSERSGEAPAELAARDAPAAPGPGSARRIAAATGVPPLPPLEEVDPGVAQRVRDAHVALAGRPGIAELWRNYGVALYADAEAYGSAASVLARAVELDSLDERATYLLALACETLGADEEARRHFTRTVALEPDFRPARLRLARTCVQTGRLDEAREQYEVLLARSAVDPHALEGRGRVSLREGDAGVAIDDLEAAVEQAPASRSAHYELGLAYRALGGEETAREHLAIARELPASTWEDPWLDELYEGRGGDQSLLTDGNQARLAGDWARAEALFAEYVKRRPEDPVGWLNLAAARRDLGRHDEAMAAAEESLRLDPSIAGTHALLGTLLARGDSEEALARLDHAVRLRPELAQAWFDRAEILARVGRHDAAVLSLDEYLVLRPADPIGYLRRAEARLHLGAFAEADRDLAHALALDPRESTARYRAGGLALRAGNPAAAATHFAVAVDVRPDWAEAHYGLGLALSAIGRTEDARRSWQRAAALKPESERFRRALEKSER